MRRWRADRAPRVLVVVALVAAFGATLPGQQDQSPRYRFKTGVELVNVTATVTDRAGRFVGNLTRDDFGVYEDGVLQSIDYFSRERVPVSLGIVLDTSGSMVGDKIRAAQRALDRFLVELLGPDDEVFLYRIGDEPLLVQGWTTDRDALRRQLGRITPTGETALYDTVARAVALAQTGTHRKKALVIISDGNDNASTIGVRQVRQLILQSELLVYAIGLDGNAGIMRIAQQRGPQRPRPPVRIPWPPTLPRGGGFPPQNPPIPAIPPPSGGLPHSSEEGVNATALRAITDDSGGRTEIIRSSLDLDPATAGIADELSRQYSLAYSPTSPKDGRWHNIRVVVKNRDCLVRARRGYVAGVVGKTERSVS
ncbi:MAG: VWA domain-containing protein [Acidobacteria bacterium]|nr:VWA domain-containing protein [Acidobacteriota bacterium]